MDAIALKRIMSPVFGRLIHRFDKADAFSVPKPCNRPMFCLSTLIYNHFSDNIGALASRTGQGVKLIIVRHFSASCTFNWHD